jgi:HD-like signal output (HDOD) protein
MAAQPVFDQAAKVQELVSNVNELAVLPHVIFRVLEISGSSDSPASEIEKAIVVDPGFSTKLLTHANSSYYGLPRKVTSIREAVVFLGYKAVRQMAMTVGMFDLFVGKNDKESLRRRAWWRHSIDTAVCCRWISQRTAKVSPDEAYTCGLLHIIGKTLLDRFEGQGYERVEGIMNGGQSEIIAEQIVFGCDHMHLGEAACRKWGLPEPLSNAMLYEEPLGADHEHAAHRATVALSTRIAAAAVSGASAQELPEWALSILGLSPADTDELFEQGTEKIASAGNLQF